MFPLKTYLLLASGVTVLIASTAPYSQANASSYGQAVAPFLKRYCLSCHSGAEPSGGLSFEGFRDSKDVLKARETWAKVVQYISSKHMPPAGAPQPTDGERKKVTNWIEATLTGDCKDLDPGRVTIRRLNRAEYDNTIRDLTGLDMHLADDFPSDDVGYGFDNIGDVLSLSPLLMEKYLAAAEKVSRAAITVPGSRVQRIELANLPAVTGTAISDDSAVFYYTNAEVQAPCTLAAGNYRLRILAAEDHAGGEGSQMRVTLDGLPLQKITVLAKRGEPTTYELPLDVGAGPHKIGLAFLNDYYVPAKNGQKAEDRNLLVYWIELIGPTGVTTDLPSSHRRIIYETPAGKNPRDVAKRILTSFAQRAFRRPLTPEESERLIKVYDVTAANKEPFERGIQLGVQAVLSSPNFLFRVEKDSGTTRALDNYELASRLSYFLWSSMPDDELFNQAATGKLVSPAIFRLQVERMLKSPKAKQFSSNFAGQWLQLRKLISFTPDKEMFPEYTPQLRDAMLDETKLYFQSILDEDRSVLEFLDSDYTYLNGPLAKHYGIANVTGGEMRRVKLADRRRGGLITQGSILTLTSNPTRSSPVKRGKWILETLLGTPPPPPPPGVGTLSEDKRSVEELSLRQRLEEHRKDPKCSSCHAVLDPLGFGLENFDATGAWRTMDGKFPVESNGVLPDGAKFEGVVDLKSVLMHRKDDFVRCLAEKMLTYAIGRGVEDYRDKCAVDEIVQKTIKANYRMSAMIQAVVESEPFLKQGTEQRKG